MNGEVTTASNPVGGARHANHGFVRPDRAGRRRDEIDQLRGDPLIGPFLGPIRPRLSEKVHSRRLTQHEWSHEDGWVRFAWKAEGGMILARH
jgi:hypothetical protein